VVLIGKDMHIVGGIGNFGFALLRDQSGSLDRWVAGKRKWCVYGILSIISVNRGSGKNIMNFGN
tara:strand:- start:2868 stop:3059 length:192 start_codon:yes stop_codon:yes gene_type:complete